MNVKIFSTTSSSYCLTLKKYLEEKNVSYTEKLIDRDDDAKNEMLKESGGFLGTPFTVIFKDDGSKDTIVGFDRGKFEQALITK